MRYLYLGVILILAGCRPEDSLAPRPNHQPSRLEIDSAQITIAAGKDTLLQARVYDGSGELIATPPIDWRSSAPGIAQVSPTGVLTALASGQATITASVAGLTAFLNVEVLAPLSSSSAIEILDAHIVEYTYPGYPNQWNYAPIIRVRAGASAVTIDRIQVTFPGKGAAPSLCASLQIPPFNILDLNRELYGDYEFSNDAQDWSRAPSGSPFSATLKYQTADGHMATITLELPVVSGDLPTTYTGGSGRWALCR